MPQALVLSVLLTAVTADFGSHGHHGEHGAARQGRQEDGAVPGGVDFSACEEDPETGLCCVDKEETVTSLEKEPILECTHKNVEQCHYTYVTQFTPSQEEVSQPLSIVANHNPLVRCAGLRGELREAVLHHFQTEGL